MNADMQKLLSESLNKAAIHVEALPSLDLYIDQVITLIEQGYAANKRTPDEKSLTKMMVNNYSKAGLVRPIKGKKYTREHIVQMLIIYALKGTLSIGEIKRVLDTLYAQSGFDSTALFDCYESALTQQHSAASTLETQLAAILSAEADSPQSQFAALMTVCAVSDALSELAGRMTAAYFSSQSTAAEKKK